MYNPPHFRETRDQVMHELVERHSLGLLIAVAADGITANHVPMLWLPGDGHGWLRGHIARANPLWRTLSAEAAVLAVFSGPQHYVSPSWYPSKREHGKVVPTWNYASVQLRGQIRFIEDAAWLRALVTALTERHEQARAHPWQVSDAPTGYLDDMLRAIVGFEVRVTGVEGKFKGSQNRSAADRAAVAAGLRTEGVGPDEVALLAPPPGTQAR